MMKMKRIVGIFLAISLIVGTSSVALATETKGTKTVDKASPSKAFAYIKPDFTVQLNESIQIFKNAKGQSIYPLVYNGSTYLPVRAISSLMEEEIEWDNYSRTVYIGKTLSNPNKSRTKKADGNNGASQSISKESYIKPTQKSSMITISIRPDITIMYDFEIQNFKDINGNKVYPIIYEGSTYLPVRAISSLMKQELEWDEVSKIIKIGTKEETEEIIVTPITKRLVSEFENAIETYDQATEKVMGIYKCTDSAVLTMMAASVTEDVRTAEKQGNSLHKMKVSKMTEEEKQAYIHLCEFVEMSQYYLLALENIAYLAASGADYSMLAETFLEFAVSSQAKMNTARTYINALPQ